MTILCLHCLQFSTRVDVLSPEFIGELEKLQVRGIKEFRGSFVKGCLGQDVL